MEGRASPIQVGGHGRDQRQHWVLIGLLPPSQHFSCCIEFIGLCISPSKTKIYRIGSFFLVIPMLANSHCSIKLQTVTPFSKPSNLSLFHRIKAEVLTRVYKALHSLAPSPF